ncbi:MAG TPA: ABC transporter substrate-binding protein [bacterium]|nr:ABC transporter substrate-binding protein [bacterium]
MNRIRAGLVTAAAVTLMVALMLPTGVWGAPKSGLVVVSGMWSPPNNFSPINTDSSYGFYAIRFMFTSLVSARLDNNQLKFSPALASKWDVGADHQTYTFTIHPKAAWHDGQPVTADDVLFTIMTISDPKTETNRGANIADIAGLDARGKRTSGAQLGVRVLGPKTVEIKTSVPVDPAGFLEKFGANVLILPKHVLAEVPPDQLAKHPFFLHPTVGDGPFKFVQYRPDEFVELAANDSYHLGAPRVRRVFVRIIPPTTMLAQLQRNDLDVTAGFGIGEILIDDWDRVKTMDGLRTIAFAAPGYQYMLVNWKRPFLQDKRVRRALAEAINRPLIVSQLLKRQGQIAEGPVPPTNPYFDKQVKPWPYDPNQAKALLQEAGWDPNRTLTLRVPIGNIIRERSSEIIRENLVAVGIKTDIQKSDFPTHIAALRGGNYDLALLGWTGTADPDVSSQYRTGGQYNLGFHSIAQMDQSLDEGVKTADPAKRHQVYDQFQEIFADQLPVIVLYYNNALTAISKRMSNVLTDVAGQYDFDPYAWVAGPQ